MKINKLNYENYVIDYIEGTLSIELKKDFDLFLEKNREVYDEIKDYMSAPVLEEPEVVYTDKKVILQKNYTGRYVMLALLPIILIGAYLLTTTTGDTKQEITPIVNKLNSEPMAAEDKNPVIELEKIEIVKEQEEIEIEQIEEVQIVKVEDQKRSLPKLKKETFEIKKVSDVSNDQMNFASTDKVETSKEFIQLPKRETLDLPTQIGSLPMNFDVSEPAKATATMAFAAVKTFSGSDENRTEVKDKKGWLELITPASFEDIDLKESLAIQSAGDEETTTRKILNAFIPETLVK